MFLRGVTRATKAMWSVVASQRITSHHNSLFSLLKVMSKGGGKVSHLPKSAEVKKAFPRSRILQESVPNKLKTPQIANTENAVLWTFLPKFSCSHPQTTAGRDESTESAWIFRRFQRCSNLPSFLPDPALPLYFIIRFTLCFLSHSLQLSVSSLIYSLSISSLVHSHFPFPLSFIPTFYFLSRSLPLSISSLIHSHFPFLLSYSLPLSIPLLIPSQFPFLLFTPTSYFLSHSHSPFPPLSFTLPSLSRSMISAINLNPPLSFRHTSNEQ